MTNSPMPPAPFADDQARLHLLLPHAYRYFGVSLGADGHRLVCHGKARGTVALASTAATRAAYDPAFRENVIEPST